ncbi:hypothetical protein [Anaerotignum sp. MB30-C6]|uniref:hypothetical protein n=1 Tax=Anaerotignum sp. MB30-C6 TaxID=3070814 RepID=UPI0027DDF7CD|nr:hypothetical protein [Anaerotignum sp. MB30-C6]WMI81925.1 hypothetical protein RBQ60_04125 [Anaerotignum sp. MB30-C6]
MVTCCKDCTSRHYKCHGTCKTYQAWVDESKAEKAEKAKKADGISYNIERAVQIRRRMGRG